MNYRACGTTRRADLPVASGARRHRERTSGRASAILAGALTAILLLVASPARAVILLEKGKTSTLRGYLIKADNVQVVVDVQLPDGRKERREFPRTAIEELIIAVEPQRLAALDPGKPEAYRDYAEELAEKREDPDARVTAIRLYLIAAYLKPSVLGRSSLLGMTRLARSAREEREFRAMSYLLDAKHDPSVLSEPAKTVFDAGVVPEENRGTLRNLLRLVRTSHKDEALDMLNRPAVKLLLPRLAPAITEDELRAAAAGMSPQLLRKILDLELALAGATPRDTSSKPSRIMNWAQPIARNDTGPVASLQLESLTEFDPRDNRFREGKWVSAPADGAKAAPSKEVRSP